MEQGGVELNLMAGFANPPETFMGSHPGAAVELQRQDFQAKTQPPDHGKPPLSCKNAYTPKIVGFGPPSGHRFVRVGVKNDGGV